jgi:hypothetical protein
MNKHTPGPWYVKGGTPLVAIDRTYDIIAGASLIAQTLIAPERSAAAANAVLIAAAPDMLSALIAILDDVSSTHPKFTLDYRIQQCAGIARAAIARATGQTP